MVQQSEPSWYKRASLLLDHRRPKQAARLALLRLQDNPHDVQAHLMFTYALIHQRHYQEALDSCRTTLQVAPETSEAFYLMATIYLHTGYYAEAEAAITTAIRLSPYRASYYAWQTQIRYHAGLLYGALEASEVALQLNAQNADALMWRALTLASLQRLAGVTQSAEVDYLFAQLLRLAPGSASVHANLGYVLLLRRDAIPAIYHLREALRLDPTRSQTQQHLHQAHVMQHWSHRAMDWHSVQQKKLTQLNQHRFGQWLLVPCCFITFYSLFLGPLLLIQSIAMLYEWWATRRWKQEKVDPSLMLKSWWERTFYPGKPIIGWTSAGLAWAMLVMATAIYFPLSPPLVWLFVSVGMLFPLREAWKSFQQGERHFPLGVLLLLSPGSCALMKAYSLMGSENAEADTQGFLCFFALFLAAHQLYRVGPLPTHNRLQL